MKKFLVILLAVMFLVSFSLSIGCKKAETPPTPEKPAVETPETTPAPEQAPAPETPMPAPEKE